MYLGTYGIDEYVPIPVPAHRFSTGAAYQPSALTYSIYEEGNTTGIDEDVDMTPASPFDSITGAYYARRQLTAAAGFEANKTYVVIVKATVDSVAAIAMHIFQIRPLQTGDSYARIGAPAGASVSADIASILSKLLKYVQLLARKDAAIATDNATELTAINADGGSGAGVFSNQTDAVEAVRDRGDAAWITATSVTVSDKTGFSLSATGADLILKSSTFVQAIVAAINELATYGLTALNTLLVTTGIKAASVPNVTLANGAHGGAATVVTLQTPIEANVASETNHDFTALQKTSLNAATPASVQNIPVDGTLNVNVKSQDNIDFGALQKASITAAVPTAADVKTAMEAAGGTLALSKTILDKVDNMIEEVP